MVGGVTVVVGATVVGGAVATLVGGATVVAGACTTRMLCGATGVVGVGSAVPRPTTNAAAITIAVTTAATAVGITHGGRGVGAAGGRWLGPATCSADWRGPALSVTAGAAEDASFMVWIDATYVESAYGTSADKRSRADA